MPANSLKMLYQCARFSWARDFQFCTIMALAANTACSRVFSLGCFFFSCKLAKSLSFFVCPGILICRFQGKFVFFSIILTLSWTQTQEYLTAWKRPDHTAGCVCVVCPAWRDLWDQTITDRRVRKRERMGGGWRQQEKRCWVRRACDGVETLQTISRSGTAEARATSPVLPGNGKRGSLESEKWHFLVSNTAEGSAMSTFLIPNGRQVITSNINDHKYWYFQPSKIFRCGKGNCWCHRLEGFLLFAPPSPAEKT